MITLISSLSIVLMTPPDCGTNDCPTATVTALAASHHGSYDGRALIWHTRVVAQDGELLVPATYRVSFAVPLASTTEVSGDGPHALEPVRDELGRLVAVDTPRAAWSEPQHKKSGAWTRELSLTLREPVPLAGDISVTVPLVEGQAVQKAVVSGTEGLSFEPDLALGIEQHLRYFVQSGISADERQRCDGLVGERELLPRQLGVFLRADSRLHDAALVVGRLVPNAPHRQQVAVVAIGGTVALLALLGVAYRLLARPARLERLLALVHADLKQPASGPTDPP